MPDCPEILKFWCHYFRRAVRGYDGRRLLPIPVCRFLCPTPGHGTTSYLPPFLLRCLQYAARVVEAVVEAKCVGPAELLDLADGPSAETVVRWTSQLPSIAVRERILSRVPESWRQVAKAFIRQTEQGSTWMIARICRRFFKLDIAVTGLLQRMRLSLMNRYTAAH